MIRFRFWFNLLFAFSIFISGCQKQYYLPFAWKPSLPTATSSVYKVLPQFVNETATQSAVLPSATPTDLPTPTPTQQSRVNLPLLSKSTGKKDLDWTLTPQTLNGNKENGRYLMQLIYPVIEGDHDQRLDALDAEIQNWINIEMNLFLDIVQRSMPENLNGFMAANYSVPSNPTWSLGQEAENFQSAPAIYPGIQATFNGGAEILSILFQSSQYSGGAHPSASHASINYDISNGKALALADLFRNDSDYLRIIADRVKKELSQREGLFPDQINLGAAPTLDNYRTWNTTPAGLLITFEEYQVGAYAAGPQSVLIPYAELRTWLSPTGPLGKFAKSD